MKILNAEQIRAWDQYTIQHEPVTSIDLMERAAGKCVDWLEQYDFSRKHLNIFCGKGNNGGDGLAIARIWAAKGNRAAVFIIESVHKGTDDFQTNLARLRHYPEVDIHFVQSEENFYSFEPDEIIIDALYGSGLNRGLEGITAKLVEHINNSGCEIISIDIPSGLFVDHSSKGNTIIKANHTLCFQCYKPAFLVAENADFIGKVHVLDIGLMNDFYESLHSIYELVDAVMVHSIYKPRKRFSHKGNYGHSLMVAGSYGKMGAAVLSSKACLRSGTGLLSCHIPKCGYEILQTSVPEAMVMTDFNSSYNTKIDDDLSKFDAIGIGPGIGTASETKMLLHEIFDSCRNSIVLDADALNIIASQKDLLKLIPAHSILTPHPKEFERLFGESSNDFERIHLALQKAKEFNIIIVLKGHHTLIATPDGLSFFNSTGNAGMAKGGSGDVLTGILTALFAQGHNAVETAILAVYLHGIAGEVAAKKTSQESMIAGDIIDNLGNAFLEISDF